MTSAVVYTVVASARLQRTSFYLLADHTIMKGFRMVTSYFQTRTYSSRRLVHFFLVWFYHHILSPCGMGHSPSGLRLIYSFCFIKFCLISCNSRYSIIQMDLMESNLFAPPMILLQTVMEEVRHRSLPLYNRLKALLRAEEKRIWVFYNEYRS